MMKVYSDASYFEGETGYANYFEQEHALRATFRRLMATLKNRSLTGGSLLEIGCGYGYLLDEARAFFSSRVGTDFSSKAVQSARTRADHVYLGGIDQIPGGQSFDCIIATHVIEHVYRPKSFIEQLSLHLRPGGRIVIATPHMGSIWRRFMGRRWPSFKIPEHILYFDKESLSSMLTDAGLIKLQSVPYPHAFPLSLIASKLHIPLPALGRMYLWLPATTIALCGFRPE